MPIQYPITTDQRTSTITRYSKLGSLLGVILCVALLVQYAVMSVGFVRETPGGFERYVLRPDFIVSVTGAEMLLRGDGARLYDEAAQRVAEERTLREAGVRVDPDRLMGFNHPPPATMLVAGLRLLGLPYSVIFLIWTTLRIAAIGLSLWALSRAWPIRGVSGIFCALVALTFYPLVAGLQVGQTTAFVVLGWAAGSAALRLGNESAAGAWLALAALKPQHLPILLLALTVMRRWRALAVFALTVAVAAIAAMPFAGWDWPLRYVELIVKQATQPPNMIIDPAMMQNWRGFFMRVLNFAPDAPLYAAIATVLTALAVVLIWQHEARRQKNNPTIRNSQWPSAPIRNRLWAFTLCATMLASYHLLYPDLALAIVPGWIIAAISLARPVRSPARWAWLGWLWLGWALGFLVNYQSFAVALAPMWLAFTAICLVIRQRTTDDRR